MDAQPGAAAPAQRHAKPTPSCTAGWRARSSMPMRAARRCRQCIAQQPPRPVGPVGLRDLRRPAHRAAADQDADNIELVRQLVQAHAYWRLKGLAVDLVIWNEEHGGLPPGAARPDHGPDRRGASKPTSSTARAASSCAPPTRSAPRTASLLQSVARASSPTVAARWPTRSTAPRAARAGAAAVVPTRERPARDARPQSPAPQRTATCCSFNGIGRLHRGRPRVRHRHARGRGDRRRRGST